jgi:hypothetical protein
MTAAIARLPTAAFMAVLLAWGLGALAGGRSGPATAMRAATARVVLILAGATVRSQPAAFELDGEVRGRGC